METESYVYKKEVDWSVLMEGFTLPIENQVVFLQNMGRFLQRGESKVIHFYMDGKTLQIPAERHAVFASSGMRFPV